MPMSDLIQAAEGKDLSPLVSMDDFRKVVDLGKFAPLGNRGFIKGRGSGFGNELWSKRSAGKFRKG